jgi:hypothetical protein
MKIKALKTVVLVIMAGLGWNCMSQTLPQHQEASRAVVHRKVTTESVTSEIVTAPESHSIAIESKGKYGDLPLYFEKNQGQTDSHAQYVARGGGYTLFLTGTDAVFVLQPPTKVMPGAKRRGKLNRRKLQDSNNVRTSVLHMKLVEGNDAPVAEGLTRLEGVVNYLIGADPRKWHTGIPTYGSVQFANVYPGVDLVYYGNKHHLEYDFIVKPGANPSKIAFEFEGADRLSLNEAGEVDIDSKAGKLTLHKPAIYQLENGMKKSVAGNFVVRSAQKVGVEVKAYDSRKPW